MPTSKDFIQTPLSKKSGTGFTLIELLIVLTIIGILATVGFANYQTFAAAQVLSDAVNQTQSLVRIAQTNATASVKCNDSSSTEWLIVFRDSKNIDLKCNPSSVTIKTLTLPTNVSFGPISGGSSCTPTTVHFSSLLGNVSFTDSSGSNCPVSVNITVPIIFSKSGTTFTKNITISKGGGIDAQ